MTAPATGQVQTIRDRVLKALTHTTVGLANAMRDAQLLGFRLDPDTLHYPIPPEAHDPESAAEVQGAADALGLALENWTECAVDLSEHAARWVVAHEAMPVNMMEAASQVALFQSMYEQTIDRWIDSVRVWRALDSTDARVRVGVVDRLTQGVPGSFPHLPADDLEARLQASMEGGGWAVPPMSRTAAEKAASGDPEYTTHKDQTADALTAKEEAEIARDVAYQRLLTARALLDALAQLAGRRSATSINFASEPAATSKLRETLERFNALAGEAADKMEAQGKAAGGEGAKDSAPPDDAARTERADIARELGVDLPEQTIAEGRAAAVEGGPIS